MLLALGLAMGAGDPGPTEVVQEPPQIGIPIAEPRKDVDYAILIAGVSDTIDPEILSFGRRFSPPAVR